MTTAPTLFPGIAAGVNVSTVPQRSPFRYPGGKTWFVPHLRAWLESLPGRPRLFLEPFAGGGICACTVLVEGLANHVQIVELDEDVFSVWQTIFSQDAPLLAQRLTAFVMDEGTVNGALSQAPTSTLERAVQTILRNRVNRGGILAPGAGRLKAGENGRGLLSRWYPETLARRILELYRHRNRVTVIHGDGLAALEKYKDDSQTASFIDPPYTAGGKRAGSRLYAHWDIDHAELFELTAAQQGSILMTYNDAPEVRLLADAHALNYRSIAMKNTHHAELTELVIGHDLDWL
ncbi:DNA adenine methylase [Deinococcus frigens]|uniref:DNA adenine methylase n=1 Tax=Deinococcus frigens TaxID=249403 RepID=UPI0004957311|nr:DNA adenine methylase [Deinococcus frigens]